MTKKQVCRWYEREEKRPERNNKFVKSFWLDADGSNNCGTSQEEYLKSERRRQEISIKVNKRLIAFQLRNDGKL